MNQANQQFLARKRERIKPLSEHKQINQLLRNEFVSQLISAVNRAYIKAKLSISTVIRPTEKSQPTKFPREDSNEPLPKNMHIHLHRKTYSKTSNSKGKLSPNRSQLPIEHLPGEAQYCETNTAERKQPTNKVLLELQGTIIEKHTQQPVDSKPVCLTIHSFQLSTC